MYHWRRVKTTPPLVFSLTLTLHRNLYLTFDDGRYPSGKKLKMYERKCQMLSITTKNCDYKKSQLTRRITLHVVVTVKLKVNKPIDIKQCTIKYLILLVLSIESDLLCPQLMPWSRWDKTVNLARYQDRRSGGGKHLPLPKKNVWFYLYIILCILLYSYDNISLYINT